VDNGVIEMASRGIACILSDAAEFGAIALFVAMVLVWADALPMI
jgi:hypothetical protein